MNRRAAAIVGIAVLALAAGGCSEDRGSGGGLGGETLTVYVSVPLNGARAIEGRAIVDGARLALEDAGARVGELRVRAVYLDDTEDGSWSLARSAANARRAAEDATAIGYVGDLDSGATRASLPITNAAEIAQVSPGSTAVDLTRLPPAGDGDPERYRPSDEQTFARVVPDDEVQARAAAVWANRMGARGGLVISDGTAFGEIVADGFSEQASRLGLSVRRIRTGNQGTEGLPQRVADIGPDVVYVAATSDLGLPLLISAHRSAGTKTLAPDSLANSAFLRRAAVFTDQLYLTSSFLDPSLLPPQGQGLLRAYQRRFGHRAAPAAAYGYEAMALLLDAIRRAGDDGDDRGAVVDEVLSTQDRHSVLGTYSIDGNGDTTLDAASGYRVSDALPVFPVELRAPR